MGRRSRKRAGAPAAARPGGAPADARAGGDPAHPVLADDAARRHAQGSGSEPRTARPRPTSRRARLDEAPAPPWAPVPLTEILILLGLVALGIALFRGDPLDNPALLITGLVLVTVATLELSLREHLAGYRSHSALLSGLGAVLVSVPLAVWVRPANGVVLVAGAVVFALGLQLFRELFRRRSGGMGWRA